MAGTFGEKWARIGNAVMPLQMKAVALAVKEKVIKPIYEKTETETVKTGENRQE